MKLKTYFYTSINNPVAALYQVIHQVRRLFPIDYWLNTGNYFFPDFVTVLITERCNFRCQRCSSNSPSITKNPPQELTTNDFKKIIDQLSVFKPALYFCGGEPTLRSDLFTLLDYAKKKNLVTGFTTNGSLLNSWMISRIFKAKTDFVSFSLDGPRDYHDKIRGYNGAYEKVISNIQKILDYRHQHKLSYPHVKISGIIDVTKIENSYHVLEIAKRLKVDEICFGMLMYYTPESERKQKVFLHEGGTGGDYAIGLKVPNNYRFDYNLSEVKKFYQTVRKEKEIKVTMLAPDEKYLEAYFNPRQYPANDSKCQTPWFTCLVKSNGDVGLCQGLVGGNIKDERLLKIWNCDSFKRFRCFRKNNINPACFRCNEGQKIKFMQNEKES